MSKGTVGSRVVGDVYGYAARCEQWVCLTGGRTLDDDQSRTSGGDAMNAGRRCT